MVKIAVRLTLLCLIGLTVVLTLSSAFRPKEMYRDQIAVLMYHHVHDTDKSSGTITTKLFREQLSYLKSKGYHFIDLEDLRKFLAGAPVPPNAALVTFDDGYESFYTNAYPVLKDLGIPAVNFIITKDLADPKGSYIPSLSREEIHAMQSDSNLADIQCHTNALHGKTEDGKALLTGRLTVNGKTETNEQYRKRIADDTKVCLQQIEETTGQKPDAMAYPYGIYNEDAENLIHDAGISYAFTILPKMTTRGTDPLKIPRINAGAPNVTPESLHNMIMRRVVAVDHPFDNVVLRDTLEQIGGELAVDPNDGYLILSYNGRHWKIKPNDNTVLNEDGSTFKLQKPIRTEGNRTYIRLDDLEHIVGMTINYNPATQTFTADLPRASDFDSESGAHGQSPAK